MIIYKDIIKKLREKGYKEYILKENGILSANTFMAIRHGKPISLNSIDKICELLECKVEDIIEYVEKK